jgi:hypothetical protein
LGEREVKLIGMAWGTEEKEDGAGTGKWRAGTDASPPPDFRRLKSRRCVKTNGCIPKNFLTASGLPYLFHMRKSNKKMLILARGTITKSTCV